MGDRARAEAQQSYLVEHYRPGLTVDELRQWAELVRDTVAQLQREGRPLRYVGSAIVPGDESLLCVLEAASEELIREAYARAGIPFERLSPVIPEGGRGWAASRTPQEEEK